VVRTRCFPVITARPYVITVTDKGSQFVLRWLRLRLAEEHFPPAETQHLRGEKSNSCKKTEEYERRNIVNRMLKFIAFLLCLCVAVAAAYAQEKCSLQTITGTYAMYERGSSMFVSVNSTSAPFYPGVIAPFATVIEVTFDSKGIGNGFYWIWAGTLGGLPDPTPVQVTITELKPDCTGNLTYVVPGSPPDTIVERFIVLDEGREIRTIPISLSNGLPGIVWTGTAHRISKSSKPVNSCGPQTAHGSYLTSCENLLEWDSSTNTAFADALLMRLNVAMTGNYTGTLHESVGGRFVDGIPVNGTITVNPDCSFSQILNIPAISGTVLAKGVYFEQGKQAYAMAVYIPGVPADQQGIKYSLCQVKRIDRYE